MSTDRLVALAAIVAALTSVAACDVEPPPPTSGTITGMSHDPGHYEHVQSSVCVAYDSKTFQCSQSIDTSSDEWHGPTWTICLRADDDPKHVGCIDVAEGVYSQYTPGGHYPDAR
jgi:hypothetical protein